MARTPLFNDEEVRVIRDTEPTFSDRAPGVDLAGKLNAKFWSSVEQIDDGDTTVAVVVGSAWDGMPATASIATAGSSALYVKSVEWDGSGTLTVTVDQDPGADLAVAIIVAQA